MMEGRFRNFINTRWTRPAESETPIQTSDLPYHSSPSSAQQPNFPFQLRDNGQAGTRRSGLNAMPLRSFSYESLQAGKTPTFGALPQKGNGPIKLQTSRRLSSGELISLPQDSQRTLEDIREDGYIVGKKDKQKSPKSKHASTVSPSRPGLGHTSYSAPSLQAPFVSSGRLQSAGPSDDEFRHSVSQTASPLHQPVGLGVFQPSSPGRISRSYDPSSEYRSYSRQNSVSAESTRSSTRQTQDSNATLKALRKAEYMKLVELYGSDTAARNLAYFDACQIGSNSNPVPHGPPTFSPVILEPLPLPPIESETRRFSQSSSTSESTCSGSSSPQRVSYVSSIATGQTSIEEDSAATREDIRKMVESMRNSYLSALESREPSPPKQKSRKSRRSKHVSTVSPSLTIGQPRSSVNGTISTSRAQGRQTWHPADADRDLRSQRRINSHPPSGFGRLSPIEASPPRDKEEKQGLRRADSGTLGQIMADATRAEIRSRSSTLSKVKSYETEAGTKPQTSSRRSRRAESWLELDSDHSEKARVELPHAIEYQTSTEEHPESEPRKDSDDFDDLFSSELWSSSTSVPSLTILSTPTPLSEPLSRGRPRTNEATPSTPKRKVSHITSIPESPEYTHLATSCDPENNFI